MTDLAQKIADAVIEAYAELDGPDNGAALLKAIRSALPVAQGEAVAVDAWVRHKPTKPGAYWLKGNMLNKPELVSLIRVECVDGELCVYSSEDPFGTAALLSQWSNDFLWLGPLLPAPPASRIAELEREVERLREALAAMLEIHGVTQRYADTHIEIPQSWVDSSEMARKALAAQEKK